MILGYLNTLNCEVLKAKCKPSGNGFMDRAFVSPQNSRVEIPNSNQMIFGSGVFGRDLGLAYVLSLGPT